MSAEGGGTRSPKRVFLTVGIVSVFFLSVGGVLLFQEINRLPEVIFPEPEMPEHNAYDLFVSAVDEKPETTGSNELLGILSNAKESGQPLTDTERQIIDEAMADMSETLARIRSGMELEYVPYRDYENVNAYPELASYKELTKMLAVEGHYHTYKGEYAEAMRSFTDGMRFGSVVGNERGLIDYLVGVAMMRIGQVGTWDIVENLDADSSRKFALEVQQFDADSRPISEILQEERYVGQATLLNMFKSPDWRKKLASFVLDLDMNEFLFNIQAYGYTWKGKKKVFEDYDHHMQEQIDYYEGKRATQPSSPEFEVIQALIIDFDTCQQVEDRIKSHNELLATMLALRSYYLEKGAYPEKLEELVPRYLLSVPVDPYAKKPFVYRNQGKTYLLYSIGPDLKDDHGTPILPRPGSTKSIVRPGSIGDIVAGHVY